MATVSDKYEYALIFLHEARCFNWSLVFRSDVDKAKYERLASLVLRAFLQEAQAFPESTLLEHFWSRVCSCNERLDTNVTALFAIPRVVDSEVIEMVFLRLDPKTIDWAPILRMADDMLRYLGFPFFNTGANVSSSGSGFSIDDTINLSTDGLLREVHADGGLRGDIVLQSLAVRRDGPRCVVTKKNLRGKVHESGFHEEDTTLFGLNSDEELPEGYWYFSLARLIPLPCHSNIGFLEWIRIFAGDSCAERISAHVHGLRNVFNLELQAYRALGDLLWAIEATPTATGHKYIFRRFAPRRGIPTVFLEDGEELFFGRGVDHVCLSDQLPDPTLCNVRLAITQALHASGATRLVASLKEDADDTDYASVCFTQDEFLNILNAKLQLAGGSLLLSSEETDR
ncbi:hypothetical protein BXZ70DRAFT_959908 [Cristinia sonorae]|uniref:Uncharacterized protein n=1 Tax=Cristinia sonorae TaxID=1940300 RepID=A0A8K0XKK8_9AGAR|nr:hypothetical protein BXZ70DRAFT_959908 [Cristinia sonorae]